ncbi:MAG TPA: TetR family transcriptional regulator [Xanthomonadaceae bacterium]|nr:TetR family transcriptional regulator [Xanthomonadaceae bacterium]
MSVLPAALQARKQPLQSRSRATVEAIREACIQVLLAEGLSRTTTTRVAERAGVSVGSLYQYYPNRGAMLAGLLAWHLEHVTAAVEDACRRSHGMGLDGMSRALVAAFLHAKLQHVEMSRALYAISEMHGGAALMAEARRRWQAVLVPMLASARDLRLQDVETVADVAMGALTGPVRSMLESDAPQARVEPLRAQLVLLLCSYLRAAGAPA